MTTLLSVAAVMPMATPVVNTGGNNSNGITGSNGSDDDNDGWYFKKACQDEDGGDGCGSTCQMMTLVVTIAMVADTAVAAMKTLMTGTSKIMSISIFHSQGDDCSGGSNNNIGGNNNNGSSDSNGGDNDNNGCYFKTQC